MLEVPKEIQLGKGTYRLVERRGDGGQGSVWEVVRIQGKATFALKTSILDDDPERRRLLAESIEGEISLLQRLPDPETHFIIPCLDSGYWYGAGVRFPAFVMPYHPDRLSLRERAPNGATLLRWAV